MLVYSKKTFLFPEICPGTEYSRVLIWKKSLLICFESCRVFSIPTQVELTQDGEHFAYG